MGAQYMQTVSDAVSSRNNNFDLLRLFAALIVLWAHSYPLTDHGADDIFTKSLFGYDMAGSFAVLIFFVISGFLVTKSVTERGTGEYLAARALRILPALVCAVFVTVFVIGPLLTKLAVADYFSAPGTLAYLRNVFVFGIQYDIPAATKGLPYAGSINSSLWTLSLECGFYIALVGLVSFGLLTPRRAGIFVAAMVALYFYCAYVLGLSFGVPGPSLWQGATLFQVAKNGCAFFLGGAIWIYRDKVPLNAGVAIACALALYAAVGTSSATVVYALALPYLVIYAALGLPAFSLRRLGDLSYATYLFAFPIQQLVINWIGGSSPTNVSLIATPIVLTISYFSWWYLERPFLALKKHRGLRVVSPVDRDPKNDELRSEPPPVIRAIIRGERLGR